MFRFLGEVNSHRKKGKARGTPHNARKQSSVGMAPSKNCPSQIKNLDQFLDSMSIETSLYTTPSKPTIQYPLPDARMRDNAEWESTQGSEEGGHGTQFTAELALVQYKLGGWQSPPVVESSLTPSTESTVSSQSPSISHRKEERIRDKTESYRVFRSGWVKHPQISRCLHTVDYDPHVFANKIESNLEVQSTTSSEISWYFDSRAYHERLSSAITSYDHKTTTIPGNVITDARSRMGDEEESVCSSVSSIYTYHFCHDTPESNISTWSPTTSPVDHVVFENGREEYLSRDMFESYVTDGNASQGTVFSRKNNSIHSENDESMLSKYEEQVSFSELISRYEDESLAERLAPYNSTPRKRLFGRMIDTNSLISLPGSSSSDIARPQTEGIESSCKPLLSTPKQNSRKIVTPKIKNTSTSPSNYNHMISNYSGTNPDTEVEAHSVEAFSSSKGSSKDCANFPMILSKFEAQSLEYGMELPAPRRLSKETFEATTNMSYTKETASYCSDDELHKTEQYQQDELDSTTFQGDNLGFRKETIARFSSSCHEEIHIQDVNDNMILYSHRFRSNKDSLEVGEKSLQSTFVAENAEDNVDEIQKVELDKVDNPLNYREIHEGKVMNSCNRNDTISKTVPISQQGENSHQHFSKSGKKSGQHFDYGPVGLSELSMNGLQQGASSQQINSFNREKAFYFHTESESDVSAHDKSAYFGPVDLDESISTWDGNEEEGTSKWRSQSDNGGRQNPVDMTVIDQSYKKKMSSITASKRAHSPKSIFLCKDELARLEESMEHDNHLEHSMSPGHDDWKREKEIGSICHEELHKKVMTLKDERRGYRFVSKEPHQFLRHSHEMANTTFQGNTKLTINERPKNTRAKTPPWKRKIRVWKFLIRILHKNNEDSTRAKNGTGKKNKKENEDKKKHTNFEKFSPKTVPSLPPCAICKVAERTHIALPCMHYSFCSECAKNLCGSEIPVCPICQTERITLNRVYT